MRFLPLFAIAIGITGLYLESQCRLGSVIDAIKATPNIGEWAFAMVLMLIILSVIGEPYSTWLAVILIVSVVFIDYEKNGSGNNIFKTLGLGG